MAGKTLSKVQSRIVQIISVVCTFFIMRYMRVDLNRAIFDFQGETWWFYLGLVLEFGLIQIIVFVIIGLVVIGIFGGIDKV